MTAKQQQREQQMARDRETDGILRDMRAACSSGDDILSLRNGHKLFRNITAATNSNRDKIEKILAGIATIPLPRSQHNPAHAPVDAMPPNTNNNDLTSVKIFSLPDLQCGIPVRPTMSYI